MTAPDVRTAAQEEAEKRWMKFAPSDTRQGAFESDAFIAGAVWGAALVTPTRRRAILAVQQSLGCDIDGLEGFMPGCGEHELEITEEGLCPNATAAADVVVALIGSPVGWS
ncbi:hypothetical protein [Leucobacter sp. M11]|uniref:hypothetical protein n=1 Tax=Leucobacter sp. M11 TaxID=2993565 RepID=UPI002D80829B|nr:hypothetical protein [Leucobacter sp. M11]MEB4614025.1 hypothetical protein [Leucobacter sp. M11]